MKMRNLVCWLIWLIVALVGCSAINPSSIVHYNGISTNKECWFKSSNGITIKPTICLAGNTQLELGSLSDSIFQATLGCMTTKCIIKNYNQMPNFDLIVVVMDGRLRLNFGTNKVYSSATICRCKEGNCIHNCVIVTDDELTCFNHESIHYILGQLIRNTDPYHLSPCFQLCGVC